MDEIEAVSIQRRQEQINEKLGYGIMKKKYLKNRLQIYRETFQLLDAVFGGLRTIAPTKLEMEQTLEAITLLEHYWVKELKLSITPKAHLVFKHSVRKKEDEAKTEAETETEAEAEVQVQVENEIEDEFEIKLTGDMIVFGGTGDKTDEWGEKWHQEMDKQAAKTRGRIGFKLQFTTMIRSLWRDSDPSVHSKLEEGL